MDSKEASAAPGLTTVMFTDVERSTELVTSHGDEAARRLLRDHEEMVRRRVAEHDGLEVKALGDGFMVTFPSPRRAVLCAVDIQRQLARPTAAEPLRVRIGINIGEVLHEDGDIFGEAVNAAARIAAKAEGGEVLVSDVVRQLVGTVPGVGFSDRGRFRLKGFTERWRLHRVVWQEEAAAGGGELPARPPMVGRDRERGELIAALERAVAGSGALVMVSGEPGIGKTRLCDELIAEVRRRGMTALIGRCHDSEAALPYQPFAEIVESAIATVPRDVLRACLGDAAGDVAAIVPELRRAFDDLPAPMQLPAEQERRHLFSAMLDFVQRAAAQAPLLLVFDDLHWADASTLLLLQHLAERIAGTPVLLVGTYRDLELTTARPFAGFLDTLIRGRLATRMALHRLPPEDTAAVLAGLSGSQPPQRVVDAIVRETEGNPFFVEEVFRHFAEEGRLLDADGRWRQDVVIDELEVPQSVRLVIGRRLDRLSATASRVLAVAAVIGRSFAYSLLEKVLPDVDGEAMLDALDEAERAALVSSSVAGREVTFQFAHELVRQTLLSALSAPRRQRTHARIADALEAAAGSDAGERAADLAHHLYEAGAAVDTGRTTAWLLRAARHDVDVAAYEDALRLADRALELDDGLDDRTRAFLLDVRGRAMRSTGRWAEAMDVWAEALDLLERAGDHDAHMELCTELVVELNWAGRQMEAVLLSGRGLAMAEQSGRRDPRTSTLLAWSAAGFSFVGNHELATEQCHKALEGAAGLPTATRADVLAALAWHHWFWLEGDRCQAMVDQVVAAYREADLPWRLAEALGLAALLYVVRGDLARAVALGAEAGELGRRLGSPGEEFVGGRARLHIALVGGRLDEAARLATRERELAEQTGFAWATDTEVFSGLVRMWHGDWDGAAACLDRGDAAQIPSPFAAGPWGYRVLLDGMRGDRARVLATAGARRGEIGPPGGPMSVSGWVATVCLAEALSRVGEGDGAAELYPHVLEVGRRAPLRGYDTRVVETVAGMVMAAAGEWDAAEGHFDAAQQLADSLGHAIESAEVRRARAAMLLDRDRPGDRGRARELLDDARARLRPIGAPGCLRGVEDMLRAM